MTFHWSENAAFIQSVFRPWAAHDGYLEQEVQAAERALGLRFPSALRQFYCSWGRQPGMTRAREQFLGPQDALVKSGALLFCLENQGVGYWGIPLSFLNDPDPLVHYGYAPDSLESVEVGPWGAWYPLSRFLDSLTLGHAFAGGAAHGGVSVERLDEQQQELLSRHWPTVRIDAALWGVLPWALDHWTLHGSFGQAMDHGPGGEIWAVAESLEALEEIRQILALNWRESW